MSLIVPPALRVRPPAAALTALLRVMLLAASRVRVPLEVQERSALTVILPASAPGEPAAPVVTVMLAVFRALTRVVALIVEVALEKKVPPTLLEALSAPEIVTL